MASNRAQGVNMLRDDRNDGGRRRQLAARNVLGEPLEICSIKPMTGFYRDGCCNTGREDVGSHTVCVVMTSAFLEFSKSRGNDLSTPVPEFGFPGLQPGDRWCLCAPRWQEALEAGAPRDYPPKLAPGGFDDKISRLTRYTICARQTLSGTPWDLHCAPYATL